MSNHSASINDISLSDIQRAHVARQEEWCPGQKPDLSFRGNEMAGEVGEAIEALYDHIAELGKAAGRSSNVIKKLERERHHWRGSRATKDELADELADVVHTAFLCAITAGIDVPSAIVSKFNATSEKNGLTTRLNESIQHEQIDLERFWRPISEADKSITFDHTFDLGDGEKMTIRNSDEYWVRDDDGRIYRAVWSDQRDGYWWDIEGESPVDPVKYMPHPLSIPASPGA